MDDQIREIVRQETKWIRRFYTALGVLLILSISFQAKTYFDNVERNREAKQVTKELLEVNQQVRNFYLILQERLDLQ